jgi:hypothetical protein
MNPKNEDLKEYRTLKLPLLQLMLLLAALGVAATVLLHYFF